MKTSFLRGPVVVVVALLACALSGLSASAPESHERRALTAEEEILGHRTDRVLVVPRARRAEDRTTREARASAAESRAGTRALRVFRQAGEVRVVAVPAGRSVEETVAELAATGEFESVEPDRVIYATATPNDPKYTDGTLWGMNNTGQNSGVADADIDAPEAWDTRTSASGVLVAVIDTGARMTHEDLAANLWTNPGESGTKANNGIDDDSNGYVDDVHGINAITGSGNPTDGGGHGTHVSGTIGAVGNNGLGGAGVAWSAQILALKFLPDSGTGTTSDAIECIDYAIARGVRVINGSYGSDTSSNAELAAMRRARDAGIVFVVAAGNDGKNLDASREYPASYQLDNLVSVAASTRLDDVATFSNYGSGIVDLAAPGSEIYSLGISSDSAYTTLQGTSMAAPHVTGAVALLAAQFPADNYRALINRLLRSVDRKTQFAGKTHTGGRLNVQRALTSTNTRPFNDDFADRPLLVGTTVQARSASQFGTKETGEASHAGLAGGASLWWSWTAATSGATTIDTVGSAIDTLLGVYTGTTVGGLTLVGSNDDTSGTTSRVAFTATAGTTYQIAVDGKAGATGLIILNVESTPANDTFAQALVETGPSWLATANNNAATKQGGEPNHAGINGGRSLWYRWTAPDSRTYAASVYSTDFDPVVAVYTGSAVNSLTPVASNNDASSGNTAALATFSAVSGQTYYIAVDGAGSAVGQFTVSLVDSDWQYATAGVITSSPAVATDGTVYVGTFDSRLLALNSTGTLKWSAAIGAVDMASPAVDANGAVYLGSNDTNTSGTLRSYTSAGGLRWSFPVAGAIPSSPAIAADGTVYFRAEDNYLYALNGATGAQKWRFNTGGISYSSPSLATDGTVYVGSDSNNLFAVNPDGSQKWSFATNGGVYVSPAVGGDGTVYCATLSGRVYGVTAAGAQRWSFDAGGGISSSPVVGPGGLVYFGSYDGKLYALNGATGAKVWDYETGSEIRASAPVVGADGTVYQASYDKKLHAVDASTGAPKRIYAMGEIIRSSPILAGGRLYVGCNDRKLYALPVTAGLAGSDWPAFRHNARRTGRAEAGSTATAPTIVTAPKVFHVPAGYTATFTVMATGTEPFTYQWKRNGVNIPGATSATLTLSNAQLSDAANFSVTVSNAFGSVTSSAAALVVGTSSGRVPAISMRARVGTGAEILVPGLVVGGSTTQQFLVRALGPKLGDFGIDSATRLNDPLLKITQLDGTVIAQNDNWSDNANAAAIATTATNLGAQPLTNGSKDAVLLLSLPPGIYTPQISGVASTTGVALVEFYNVDATNRVPAISMRARVGTGTEILVPGLVVEGTSPKMFLVRALGPKLGDFGIDSATRLNDPVLKITQLDGTVIAENDNWSDGANATLVPGLTATLGAQPLTAGSADAVLLVALPPGIYTPQISGAGGTTGVCLVEFYNVE